MSLLRKYERYKTISSEKNSIFKLMNNIDFSRVENLPPQKIESVAMILPDIYSNLGGITSALRILTSFQKHGCQVTIALNGNMDVDTAKKNAMACMPNFHGNVKKVSECFADQYDICIATNWETAYWAKQLNGYKIYFVQDYEPNFYETNDFSVLARETYTFGYHVISLGSWNLDQIKMNVPYTSSKLDYVDFPYDRNEYCFHPRDYLSYKDKKEIKIVCYIRFIGRRIPYICEYLLAKSKQVIENKGYNVDISFFGIDKHNQFGCGNNLGKLTRAELAKLYQNSDFGMVASMSNISLVPFEMLASGLPVIEFREGSYPYFLGDDTALLTDFDYRTLCNSILGVLQDPSKLITMHKKAEEKLAKLSWDKTCNQFWNILEKTIA